MDNQKPIADWTLGEIQEYCKSHTACHDCRLMGYEMASCKLAGPASRWDLTEKPHFTDQEVEAAKVLLAGGIEIVERSEYSDADLHARSFVLGDREHRRGWNIPKELFPSLVLRQSVKLSDIIGGQS